MRTSRSFCRLAQDQMAVHKMEEIRIVLIGKTGVGKSSLGNTISGVNKFKVNSSPVSETHSCESSTTTVYGRNVKLIDTPGLFDTNPRSSELSPELLKCIEECAPGPHAFLLVLRVDKYTTQEQAVVNLILKYFSEEALKYTTLVFTHGNDLPDDKNIKDWANENPALRSLLQRCGGRCHVFDNKHWNNSQDSYRNNQHQIRELLDTIDQTVQENGGSCYTNEMLVKVAANKNILAKLTGVSTGILLGALLGVPATLVFVVQQFGITSLGKKPVLVGGVVVGGVVGAAYGGYKGYKAAENAETPKEAAEAVWQEVQNFLSDIKSLFVKSDYQKLD